MKTEAVLTLKINDAFYPVFDTKKIYVQLMGGRGSGKSHFIAKQYLPTRCVTEKPIRVMAMRKVATSIRLSIWPALLEGIKALSIPVEVNKTDREIRFPNGSLIACSGADDPEKLKSLESFDVVWKEEATEFTEADHLNIDAAIKSDRRKIIDTYNPIPLTPDYSSYLKRTFWDETNPDALCIKTTYRDNARFLPAHYINSLERLRETNPKLWDMWANGNYVTLEGVIFDNWDTVDAVPTEGGIHFLGYGLDFGFSDDPAALVAIWQRGTDVWIEEKLYRTGCTNPDLCSAFKELGMKKTDTIIADSAEPKSIEEIHRAGWNVHPAVKGADSVRAGINRMKSLKIHVVRGSSNLIKELSAYSWKKDRDGKALAEPVDAFNHAIDACRYRINSQAVTIRGAPLAARGLGL